MKSIIREYPIKKKKLYYPTRYSKDFDEFIKFKNTSKYNDYKLWKDGINYKTNRKIKIGGRLHKQLSDAFRSWIINIYTIPELESINVDEYLKETLTIELEIDKKNKSIIEYNLLIDKIIEKINKLTKWEDFIEFKSNYYGIPHYHNNIHRQNDCMGDMKLIYSNTRDCNKCENGWGCSSSNCSTTTLEYECNKCGICYKKFK